MRKLLPLVLAAVGGLTLLAAVAWPQSEASAIAPCSIRQTTADEQQFLSMVQAWRNQSPSHAGQLTLSAPLNAAAAGYAQVLAQGGSGHWADGAQNMSWVTRAIQCGYPSASGPRLNGIYAPADGIAGGEGVAIAATAQEALAQMAAEGAGGGISIPAYVGAPVSCAGVAKATVNGRTGWVVMLFATLSGTCPQAVTGIQEPPTTTTATPPGASPSATHTPTVIPTATPTRTPSPTPTPAIFRAFVPVAARD